MKKRCVYLSGPVSNNPNWREDFENSIKYLKSRFDDLFDIINPMDEENLLNKEGMNKIQRLNYDFELIKKCDIIYLMKGWENSGGCLAEYGFAKGKIKYVLKEEILCF